MSNGLAAALGVDDKSKAKIADVQKRFKARLSAAKSAINFVKKSGYTPKSDLKKLTKQQLADFKAALDRYSVGDQARLWAETFSQELMRNSVTPATKEAFAEATKEMKDQLDPISTEYASHPFKTAPRGLGLEIIKLHDGMK